MKTPGASFRALLNGQLRPFPDIPAKQVEWSLSAQTCLSPTGQDAAVAARIAAVRCGREIKAAANWWCGGTEQALGFRASPTQHLFAQAANPWRQGSRCRQTGRSHMLISPEPSPYIRRSLI